MCKRGIIGVIGMVGLSLTLHADDPGLLERMNISSKKGMEAVNAGTSGKKTKSDPTVESQFNGKTFAGGGGFTESGKSRKMATFRYEEKVFGGKYENTRSFFGIKNPWIGREVPGVKPASLMTRGILTPDKAFATEDVETRALPERERRAFPGKGDVATREFIGEGKSQGSVTHFEGGLTKEMSVEEVREILNKNH